MNNYQRIKDIREDRDLTQQQVAEILEIKQTQYSRYELGKQMMGVDKYIKLAQFYNISLDYLASLIDTPRKLYDEKQKILYFSLEIYYKFVYTIKKGKNIEFS